MRQIVARLRPGKLIEGELPPMETAKCDLLALAGQQPVLQLPVMLAAAAPASLKDFVRAETDRHCRELLHATATRLEVAETHGQACDADDEVSGDDTEN